MGRTGASCARALLSLLPLATSPHLLPGIVSPSCRALGIPSLHIIFFFLSSFVQEEFELRQRFENTDFKLELIQNNIK